ncbi:unnamed protein product [Mytilus edulis]|uniref:Cadherin domain-containing protein n=1 Tax=Mytilus edulis TaxID=6550 RepID=A0A8S3RWF4_MYTED|nr:unnamed protein product [Mytilus edulis]
MFREFLLVYYVLTGVSNVLCTNCGTYISNIPEVKAVNETHTGVVWNVTVDPLTNWTFHATKVNSFVITSNLDLQLKVENYFNFTLTSDTSAFLSFNIVNNSLDKEDTFWRNTSKGELKEIHFKVNCFGLDNVPKDIRVIIESVNEFPQHFNKSFPKIIKVNENTNNYTSVLSIFPYLIDSDIPTPQLKDFTYTVKTSNVQNDGTPWFYIPIASSDNLRVKASPDFDQLHKNNISILTLIVVVKAIDESGFEINTTLQIEIVDVDDLPPSFQYPGCQNNCSVTPYEAYTGPSWRGPIKVQPTDIIAKDQDSLGSSIKYSIKKSPNNYHSSFEIDQSTGAITQIGDVLTVNVLTIVATEDTANGFSQSATLLIRLSNDSSYLPETSKVKDDSSKLRLIVIVVGAISLVIIGILIFLVIFVYKRTKKKMTVVPKEQSPNTTVEDLVSDRPSTVDEKVNNWKQTIDPMQWPTVTSRRQQLDPLHLRDESTETEEMRSSSCSDSLNKIPYQIRLKETETGLQFNISLNSSDSWSLEVKQINGRTLETRKKDYVRTFFNLTANNETNVLSFNVVKELDLEGFLKYIQIQISSIQLNFKCGAFDQREIAVLVGAVNEFAPYFKDRPYTYAMTEDKTNGTTIFTVPDHVVDKDVLRNGGFNYYIEQYKVQPSVDGRDYFQIKFSSSGLVTLKNSIDFDDLYRRGKPTYFMLNLTAEDTTNLRSWTTLNVSIIDVDDQKPMFSMCVPPCQKAQYRTNTQVGYRATEDSAKQLFDDATLLVTLGNGTSVTPPPVGKSVDNNSGNLKLVIIILAVVFLLIIIVIIIVFVVYHKKVAKAVRPTDDGKEGSADISHSQNWQAMNSGSKTELLASDMLNPALMATPDGRGNTLLPLTKDSATGTGKKRSRRRNRNKEPEIFDGTREYEGKLDMEFFTDANTKSKIKQSTRSRDTKTDPKYWITIPNDDE